MKRTHITKLAAAAAMAIAGGGLTLASIAGPASAAPASQSSTASSPFRVVPSPVVGSGGGPSLRASTAISANDVWAVGYSENSNNQAQNLAEHWNGSSWTVVPTPAGSGGLTAVSAVSSTDVWAIGLDGYHWNGKVWSVVPIRDPAAPNNSFELTGVKAISPTNVYVVGAYQGPTDPIQVIDHWNGSSWKVLANPFNAVIPSGIDASSANDIWIVGQQRSGSFTEHFNGTAWSAVPTPTSDPRKVSVLSPTNAWAVGMFDITHWNGSSWKVVSVNAHANGNDNQLTAVTSLSATDVWAVGSSFGPNNGISITETPLAEHFNGTSWSVVKTPTLTAPADGILFGMSSAGGHVYAVGSTNPNTINPSTNSYEPGTALILENDHG